MRIGRFIESVIPSEVDPQVRWAWEQASELLDSLGHEVTDIPPPYPPDAVPYFETVWSVSANTVPVDPARESLLRPLTRYLRGRGAAVTGTQYAQAIGMLALYSRQGLAATADFDAVLTPTLAMLPQPVGWFDADSDPAADFERQKRFTPFTAIYNTTGQPAISVPLFESADGQPIGVMLAGRPAAEATLLSLAAQLEVARPWRDRRPGIWDD
jgi:amidase